MNSMTSHSPALVLIDIQQAFNDLDYWGGSRNNPEAETNIAAILQHWRTQQLPVFHIKHCSTTPTSPLREGHPGNAFMDVARPDEGEPVILKNVNSAFIGTDLQARLDEQQIRSVVIIGFTTDHCVSTTTRMAANLGYETFLISDAAVTFAKTGVNGEHYSAETVHHVSLASLKDEFATILTTKEALSKWVKEERMNF